MAKRVPPIENRSEGRAMDTLTDADISALKQDLTDIRSRADDARRRRRRTSKLDGYRDSLLTLSREGASLSELRTWLKARDVVASRSTIARALKKWRAAAG